jgi:hypothetical protein
MEFTRKVYLETKDSHSIVDKHPFVELIKTNEKAANMYIDFNKICIKHIQKTISTVISDDLSKKLYRNCDNKLDIECEFMTILLNRCEKFPLEHAYMFYLGLLAGGSILKKYIPKEHDEFLTFENSKELTKEFKHFLNDYNSSEFINIVKESYSLIKNVFDYMLIQVSEK